MLEQVNANPQVVDELKRNGFAAAESALTGRTARVHGRSIQTGDVCLYWESGENIGENNELGGGIRFFASIGGEILVGVSPWQLKEDLGKCRNVLVTDDVSIIPFARLQQAMIYAPATAGKVATVIMPV